MNKITINGVEVPLKFSYKTFRILSEMWDMTVSQVFLSLGNIEGREIDAFVDIVHALVLANAAEAIDKDAVGDWLMENMDKLGEIGAAMQAAFPAVKEPAPGKQNPPIVPAGEA